MPWKSTWTDDTVERLRVLWGTGLSAALVAIEMNASFGTSFSRNAILGKAYRMSLPLHRTVSRYRARDGSGTSRAYTPRAPRQAAPEGTNRSRRSRMARPLKLIVDPGLSAGESSFAVTFMDLAWQHCKWPLTDGRYCGAQRELRLRGQEMILCPYCSRHADLAFVAPRSRIERLAQAKYAA